MRWPWSKDKSPEIVLNVRRMRALDFLADLLEIFEEQDLAIRLMAESFTEQIMARDLIPTEDESEEISRVYETDEEFLQSLDLPGDLVDDEPEAGSALDDEEIEGGGGPIEVGQRTPEEIETIAFGEPVLPRSEDAPAPNARLGDETPEMIKRRQKLLERRSSVEVPGEEF
jgi:hypothetical protein